MLLALVVMCGIPGQGYAQSDSCVQPPNLQLDTNTEATACINHAIGGNFRETRQYLGSCYGGNYDVSVYVTGLGLCHQYAYTFDCWPLWSTGVTSDGSQKIWVSVQNPVTLVFNQAPICVWPAATTTYSASCSCQKCSS
jgi:hypothetical protein